MTAIERQELADRLIVELEKEQDSTASGRPFVDWGMILEVIRRVCEHKKRKAVKRAKAKK